MLIGLPSELGITVDLDKEYFLTITTKKDKYKFSCKEYKHFLYCYLNCNAYSVTMYSMHNYNANHYGLFGFAKKRLQEIRKDLLELRNLKLCKKWECTLKKSNALKIG